jgi:hypothetical protein
VIDRTFTLEQAHTLLPVLESLLRRAMAAKQHLEVIEEEFQKLNQRVYMAGGSDLNIPSLAQRRAESDEAVQLVKDTMAEIESTGAQVKDLDVGLLDFPCSVEGEIILLCWKLGEPRITHWHGLEEGFAGRKPIDDRIARARPTKSS